MLWGLATWAAGKLGLGNLDWTPGDIPSQEGKLFVITGRAQDPDSSSSGDPAGQNGGSGCLLLLCGAAGCSRTVPRVRGAVTQPRLAAAALTGGKVGERDWLESALLCSCCAHAALWAGAVSDRLMRHARLSPTDSVALSE